MHALTSLLKRLEGKTLEFKKDLSSPDNLLRTLVAFANTAGGTVLIGVEDDRSTGGEHLPHQTGSRQHMFGVNAFRHIVGGGHVARCLRAGSGQADRTAIRIQ